MKRLFHMLAWLMACAAAPADDDAAIITTLTGARQARPVPDGFLLTATNGTFTRVVKTAEGGYSIFSTNGSSRLFPTPTGFGFIAGSNEAVRVTRTVRGFQIQDAGGIVEMVRIGEAYIDLQSTNNFRVVQTREGYTATSGALAATPGEALRIFQQRQQQPPPPGSVPNASARKWR